MLKEEIDPSNADRSELEDFEAEGAENWGGYGGAKVGGGGGAGAIGGGGAGAIGGGGGFAGAIGGLGAEAPCPLLSITGSYNLKHFFKSCWKFYGKFQTKN